MEQETFLEHYRICTSEAGREVSRTGAAINYKAIDTRNHEPVRVQLIPLATIEPEKLAQLKERAEAAEKLDHVNIAKTFAVGIDHDYFVIVSEHFEGETADSWIVENGPMAADAALRVGLQVVRALGAAAFFNLTHRAIQPSNLMIAPGLSPDGGWPFVKLLNFGLAGLELHSDSAEARELAPTISPQFASPEQRANGEIDFRSEMYSLGATMCFLLTGAAPLAVSGMKARFRIRRLPEIRRAPKPLHDLLVYLLREDPNNRPQDPVALEKQMRDCLTKIERRQAIGRKLGISLAGVVPRKTKATTRSVSPGKQVLGAFAAVAVFLLIAAGAAEYFFPDKIPYFHRTQKIGKEIGVPDAGKFAATPTQSASPAEVAKNQPTESPPAQVEQTPPTNRPETSPEIAANSPQPEPPSPALGPSEPPSPSTTAAPETSEQSSKTETEESSTREKTKESGPTSSRKSTTRNAQPESESSYSRERTNPGPHHAEVVGRTRDGRLIVRLSSGRTVILPRLNDGDIYAPRPRHRVYTDDDYRPPVQPFNPND